MTRDDLAKLQAISKACDTTPPETTSLNAVTEDFLKRAKERIAQRQASGEAEADAERMNERERQRAISNLAGRLGKRYSPHAASLHTFVTANEAQRAVVHRLAVVGKDLEAFIAEGRGLLFYGSVGTGKDHLLAAMLYIACAKGFACDWVNGQDLYGQFRDAIDTGRQEQAILEDLLRPTVLAISDPIPPAAAPTPYNLQQLYRLLDLRYRAMKCTWVSLNATSPKDADAKLSAPVFDRLQEGAEMFRCFWPSFRERKTT